MNERKSILTTHLAAIEDELRIYAWFLTDPRNEYAASWLAGEVLALAGELHQYRRRAYLRKWTRVSVPKRLLIYSGGLRTATMGILLCAGDAR